MFRNIFIVAIGGDAGSVFRYIASLLFTTKKFPLASFTVNSVGCFLIGLLVGYLLKQNNAVSWQLLMVTGFCGGFTTFSTFSFAVVTLVQQQRFFVAATYVIASLFVGILFTFLGLYCTK